MKTRFLILLSVILLAAPMAWAADKSADKKLYHRPQTSAEKALDNILRLDNASNGNMQDFVLQRPGYAKKKGKDYSKYFTPALLKAWAEAGKKDIAEGCGGVYTGEVCNIDFDVVLCAQDVPETYLYRTTHAQGDQAIITYLWPNDPNAGLRYLMVKTQDGWKLDAVDCGNKYQFNVKTSLHADEK
ncbi:MAG TPA: hypothetical protein VMU16_13055 [Candidatus Binataceae bacterium]|nr:hypothetical protein [Candidatus Binataceae bacterium]